MRCFIVILSVMAWFGCASESDDAPDLPCTPPAVRRCEAECGRGVQECSADAGGWGECVCAVHEASFDVSLEARDDGGDASADDASLDAIDDEGPEAPADGGLDARDDASDAASDGD